MLLKNDLLAALPASDRDRLLVAHRDVSLSPGQTVHESGIAAGFVCFPTTALIVLLHTTEDGCSTAVGIVGNEGMVGVDLFLGGTTTPDRAVVQIAGRAIELPPKALKVEFARGGPLSHVLLRYTQSLLNQISQTAVCNRFHSVEKRLCRWLLLCHDRIGSDELGITQERLSLLIGGRRESVAIAAGHLKAAGLIGYSRGHLRILDRSRLVEHACECYKSAGAEPKRQVTV